MRESSSCVVAVRRFTVWRTGVVVVAAAAVAAVVAWAAAIFGTQPIGNASVTVAIGAVLACAAAGLGGSLARVAPGVLACQAGRWSFLPDGTRVGEAASVAVAIDLGAFLLLCLRADPPGSAPTRWLPVERRGVEGDWHALRCALYAPPQPGDLPADRSLAE